MSEEESNNENEENEDEEDNEGEENEDDEGEEKEDEGEEGEEKEDDEGEEGEEKEDDEGEEKEEEEDEEEDKKNKKEKKKEKKEKKKEETKKDDEEQKPLQSSKFSEDKLHPSKEIKMDLNLNSSNSNNIYFNGNDITLANITPPKKTTLQLLSEISTEMDTLSSHLEEVLPPSPKKYDYIYPISNPPIISYPTDNQDLEIKKLIEKANELTNNSILNNKKEENGENKVKTFEDKCCQSDDEIEYSYNQQLEENRSREEEEYYNNKNYNTNNRRRFPYDPYKHMDYYNDLRNNNGYNQYRRRPLIYTQREYNNNYKNNFRGNDIPFERYKPGSVEQAMDILLDKK